MSKQDTEINLGNGHNLNMRSSRIVTTHETLYLTTAEKGTLTLNITVSADFDTIPEEYHEVFMNIMSAKYLGRVSFGDNPFSQCLPIPKRRWWQFWKPKTLDI